MTRYLLMQIRDPDDPIRAQEVTCFLDALGCSADKLQVMDLLALVGDNWELDRRWQESEIVFIGGSGRYSAAGEGEWLDNTLAMLRLLYAECRPTFASCWGFQALARALGGLVRKDLTRAELGSGHVQLTDSGRCDPLFGSLPTEFRALMGHEDCVVDLPKDAVHLVSSQMCYHQAYGFPDRRIYATQFHPELDRGRYLSRVRAYPEYIERILGISIDQFLDQCHDTPTARTLLPRFVELVNGNG